MTVAPFGFRFDLTDVRDPRLRSQHFHQKARDTLDMQNFALVIQVLRYPDWSSWGARHLFEPQLHAQLNSQQEHEREADNFGDHSVTEALRVCLQLPNCSHQQVEFTMRQLRYGPTAQED
jgi:hypothetical protein